MGEIDPAPLRDMLGPDEYYRHYGSGLICARGDKCVRTFI